MYRKAIGKFNRTLTTSGQLTTGCLVRYTPGNHDALLRKINGAELGNILVDHSFAHITADGKKLLVVHGDWVEDSTAVVEHPDGRLELIYWRDILEQHPVLGDIALTSGEARAAGLLG